ncbi:MAG: hypothetical protein LBT93_09405, partial [Treponema sp.]|nr:hypothetical protein [Treponema sp.]
AVLPGHGEISLDTISSVISRTRENLRGIINQIDDGNRKIYVAKFYTESIVRNFLDDNMGSLRDAFDSFIDIAASMLIYQYDRMFETLAESTHIELINDIWDGVWGEYMSDIVHPNARGYEIMADNYFNAIQPYLREHNLLK